MRLIDADELKYKIYNDTHLLTACPKDYDRIAEMIDESPTYSCRLVIEEVLEDKGEGEEFYDGYDYGENEKFYDEYDYDDYLWRKKSHLTLYYEND